MSSDPLPFSTSIVPDFDAIREALSSVEDHGGELVMLARICLERAQGGTGNPLTAVEMRQTITQVWIAYYALCKVLGIDPPPLPPAAVE